MNVGTAEILQQNIYGWVLKHLKIFDLSSLQQGKTPEDVYKNNFKMKSIRLLNHSLDSLTKMNDSLDKKVLTDLNNYLHYGNVNDSFWKKAAAVKPVRQPGISKKLFRFCTANSI